jgi:hypothetical protein
MAAGTAGEEAKAMYRELTNGSGLCERDNPGPCEEAEATIDKSRGLTAVGVAGIALSAIGGAMIVYEFVRPAPHGGAANGRVAIVPVSGGGALKVAVSF